MRLVIATRSKHKMREIREILSGVHDLEVLSLDDAGVPLKEDEEHLEPYETFEENARSKAVHFAGLTGLPTVADDSGLEVEALKGRPGVRTKRFAPGDFGDGDERDRANNEYLLRLLEDVPSEARRARYVCVAALAVPDGTVVYHRGEAPGRVLREPRGSGGFGYDPVILDEASGRSFAELSPEEKNERSHRGRAFRSLGEFLRREGGSPNPQGGS